MTRKKHSNSCVCPAKSGTQKKEEEDKVHQFLMGLNEIYVSVRNNLLIMNSLPSLDTIYNILLQDERQIQVTSTSQFNPESSSFNVNFSNKSQAQSILFKSHTIRHTTRGLVLIRQRVISSANIARNLNILLTNAINFIVFRQTSSSLKAKGWWPMPVWVRVMLLWVEFSMSRVLWCLVLQRSSTHN